LLCTSGGKKINEIDFRDVFQKAAKRGCTSTVVSRDLLSPTPSTSSTMKTPEKAEEDPHAPNQHTKERYSDGIPL